MKERLRRCVVGYPRKETLRPLTTDERGPLLAVARTPSERADRGARAKVLLAVADGAGFTDAARAAGRSSGQGVAKLVARFNRKGLAALDGVHGRGPAVQYGPAERERILRELRRPTGPGTRRDRHLVADNPPTGIAHRPGWTARGEYQGDPADAVGCRV